MLFTPNNSQILLHLYTGFYSARFYHTFLFPYGKVKGLNHDISNVGKPQTFPSSKIYWKKFWEKTNTDLINWEKHFDRSADHKQRNTLWLVKVNESRYKQFGGNPTLLIWWKNYWENIEHWLRKVNIDTINWEKLLEAFQ